MHLQPVFRDCASRLDSTSARLVDTGLCLPSGSSLSPADQDCVITAILDLVTARR